MQANRNKRGMTLNPVKPAGKEVLRKLVERSDVVVANMPPEGLEAMGVDYESLKAIKADIILATNNVFARGGPWSDRVGFDTLAQAMSGAMYMTGPPGFPSRSQSPFVDFCSATLGAMAVLAAIIHRMNTGEGQHVETALLKDGDHDVELGRDRTGPAAGQPHLDVEPGPDSRTGRHVRVQRRLDRVRCGRRSAVRALVPARRPAGVGARRAVQGRLVARREPGAVDRAHDRGGAPRRPPRRRSTRSPS